jgi:hypothetical protein
MQESLATDMRRAFEDEAGAAAEPASRVPDGTTFSVMVDCLVADDGSLDCMDSFSRFADEHGWRLRGFTVALQEDPRADALIGEPAPDFELPRAAVLRSGRLRDMIDGRVALLTFWGVG